MTLCFYDVLESTLLDIKRWGDSVDFNKQDVLDSMRARVVLLMRHVITTPLIGTAYAYPGDIDLSELLAAAPATSTSTAAVS